MNMKTNYMGFHYTFYLSYKAGKKSEVTKQAIPQYYSENPAHS